MAYSPEVFKARTRQLALRIMKLCNALPNTYSGRAIAAQLVRSGTAIGANYRAACRARSKKEMAAKLGIVEEEADESLYWMELIVEDGMKASSTMAPLMKEAEEILAMVVASIRTIKKDLRKPRRPKNES